MADKEYIERGELLEVPIRIDHYDKVHGNRDFVLGVEFVLEYAKSIPTADVVEVRQIREYLQRKLDEWNALGDRKFEPANMWGYNFIMACFDDLAKVDGKGEGE